MLHSVAIFVLMENSVNFDFQLTRDPLFTNYDKSKIWLKYCGFLDLALSDFMFIQKKLLSEQLELIADSELCRTIMRGKKPVTVDEFRQFVPLTTYSDYESLINEKRDISLPEKPAIWAHTSGRSGVFKWAPYTMRALARLADDTLAAFILSSALCRNDMRVQPGAKVMLNLPPVPYITGIMGMVVNQRLPYLAMPPLEEANAMAFEEKIREGFIMALSKGMDYSASIAVVLSKMGENISRSGKDGLPTWQPLAVLRLLKAWTKSRILGRGILPSDLWQVKGLVCGGTDTAIYRDKIKHYWGVEPLDVYVSTETGFIAMQAWNKRDMTFIPYSNFYEFIPEQEWLKSRTDKSYIPDTILLDEVETDKIYEIVVTNFYGGAFLRYRLGDLVKITSLGDKEAGISLPQMAFHSRCDDIIDISAFARLDEKTIWRAIESANTPYNDWIARKEYVSENPVLHIYVEPSHNNINVEEFRQAIDAGLIKQDKGYRDLRGMIGLSPLTVTLLAKGAFETYTQRKREAGFDLSHLKPPHMNANDTILADLLFTNKSA